MQRLIETMVHATTHTHRAHRGSWLSWLDSLAARERQRKALLDIMALPDYLKRDIGILDDKDPSGPAK